MFKYLLNGNAGHLFFVTESAYPIHFYLVVLDIGVGESPIVRLLTGLHGVLLKRHLLFTKPNGDKEKRNPQAELVRVYEISCVPNSNPEKSCAVNFEVHTTPSLYLLWFFRQAQKTAPTVRLS